MRYDTNSRCQVAARPSPPSIPPPARGTVGSPRTCCGHGCPPPEMQPRHPLLSQRRGRPRSPGMGEQCQWMDVSTRTTQKHPSRSSSTNRCKHQDEAPAWILRMSLVAPQRRWTVGLLDCVLHALELTRPALPCSPLLWNWEVILSVPKSSRGWPMGNGKGNRLLETARRDNETRKKEMFAPLLRVACRFQR